MVNQGMRRVRLTLATTGITKAPRRRPVALSPKGLATMLARLRHRDDGDPTVHWGGQSNRVVGIYHRDTFDLEDNKLTVEASIRLTWMRPAVFDRHLEEGKLTAYVAVIPQDGQQEVTPEATIVHGAEPGLISVQLLEDGPLHLRAYPIVPLAPSHSPDDPQRLPQPAEAQPSE